MKAAAFLGLGSNLGDRAAHLYAAIEAIGRLEQTTLLARSPIYQTPPMGPQDQPPYYNMALHLLTALEPKELADATARIERDLGRAAPGKRRHWGPREIDIDLLLYADRVIDTPGLTVPHPGLHERWFVLKPLTDLDRGITHPLLNKTVIDMLNELEAKGATKGRMV